MVVMKNPSKGFLGSLNRADQPIVLCPGQTTISDFLHKTSEIFLLSTKTKKLKNLPLLSAKTRSLENIFLWEIYIVQYIVQKQNIPLFRSCPCLKPAAAKRAH